MFAEVYIKHQRLFGTLSNKHMVFKREAAFIIRYIRNLSTGATSISGVTLSKCT